MREASSTVHTACITISYVASSAAATAAPVPVPALTATHCRNSRVGIEHVLQRQLRHAVNVEVPAVAEVSDGLVGSAGAVLERGVIVGHGGLLLAVIGAQVYGEGQVQSSDSVDRGERRADYIDNQGNRYLTPRTRPMRASQRPWLWCLVTPA